MKLCKIFGHRWKLSNGFFMCPPVADFLDGNVAELEFRRGWVRRCKRCKKVQHDFGMRPRCNGIYLFNWHDGEMPERVRLTTNQLL